MVVLPACFFYGQALAISSVVGWWSLMAVALKKVHFFMIILYQAKQATHYSKSKTQWRCCNHRWIWKNLLGEYIFKEGRNERKKDDHNDDMCVCILAKPTAYNSFFFISIYRTVEYFCLVECRRVVYRWRWDIFKIAQSPFWWEKTLGVKNGAQPKVRRETFWSLTICPFLHTWLWLLFAHTMSLLYLPELTRLLKMCLSNKCALFCV